MYTVVSNKYGPKLNLINLFCIQFYLHYLYSSEFTFIVGSVSHKIEGMIDWHAHLFTLTKK